MLACRALLTAQLSQRGKAIPLLSAYEELARRVGLLPVKITPFYQRKVDEEIAALGHAEGPLARLVYPTQERINLRAPGEVADWVDDRANMPKGAENIIIHKYPDRLLFTPTATCAAHCLYCFRQDVLAEQKETQDAALQEKCAQLERYLAQHPEIREVILSGGDPLTLSFGALEKIFETIAAVKTVETIRLHTRVPVFAPHALKQDEKIALLARHKVRMVIHAVHPYEICGEVEALLRRMHGAGLRLYNQFPLLRGTNDHKAVLAALLKRLDACHVQTISIFVPEPVAYSACYRMGYDRMLRLMDTVYAENPPWLTGFRFCLDTPLGKVRREHLVARDQEKNTLYFMRGAKRIAYPDLPAALDAPGDVQIMLWRD